MIVHALFTPIYDPTIEVIVKMDTEDFVPGSPESYYQCMAERRIRRFTDVNMKFEGFYLNRHLTSSYEPWRR